jgi:hypothetical protein
MPRFFFHIHTPHGELIRDDQGVELADLDTAAREAERTAVSFADDEKLGGYDYSGCYFEIRSNSGSINVPAFVTTTEAA